MRFPPQPIRVDVTFPPILEITCQDVVPVLPVKRFLLNQVSHDRLQGFGVIPPFHHRLQVFGKTFGVNGRSHQIPSL